MSESKQTEEATGLNGVFKLGDWTVDPSLDRVFRENQEVRLEPRVMKVLTLLAKRPGEVLSREELEAGAWGNIIVGYDSLSGCINKLRKALGDSPQNPGYIETVSKKGYRLIAPVQAETPSAPPAVAHVLEAGSGKRGKPVLLLIAGVLVIGIGAALLVPSLRSGPAVTEVTATKRIAVLPFSNLSNDPKQEYFVDGIADDLVTDLSNLSDVLVVSASATAPYKGKKINPVEVGKQLGANYLLQGSVRRSGDSLRMNVELINAVDGTNLWAKRFDETGSGLFGTQGEITREVVDALSLQLSAQDRKRLGHRPTTNFEAYDLFLIGQKKFKERTKEANQAAEDAYKQAIRLDPSFARAYSSLSVALTVEYFRGWSESPTSTLDRSLEMAQYATELDPGSPQAYWALGYSQLFRREEKQAVAVVEKAVELAPNYADGYGLLALINNYLGNAEDAVAQVRKGMVLNPHHSWDYPYNLGRAYYHLGRYDDAIKTLGEALDRNEYARNPRLFLIASLVAVGRTEDASWEVEKIIANSPETTITHLKNNYPISADKQKLEIFLDQLRKAGLPE